MTTTRRKTGNEERTVASMQEDYEYWHPKCSTCKKRKPRGEFSNSSWTDGSQCNTCSVKRNALRFLQSLATRPGWMDHPYKGCSPRALAEEGLDPNVFFPETPEEVQEARWEPVCGPCPVRDQCLAYGRETPSGGVWGGVFIPMRDEATQPLVESPTVDNVPAHMIGGIRYKLFSLTGKCANGHRVAKKDIRLHFRSAMNKYYADCATCEREAQAERRKRAATSK